MKWKKFPKWLKGAIIGAGIFGVLFLLSYIILMAGCMEKVAYLTMANSGMMFLTPCLLTYLFFAAWSITLPIFTIIGAIIGYIIQKVKK